MPSLSRLSMLLSPPDPYYRRRDWVKLPLSSIIRRTRYRIYLWATQGEWYADSCDGCEEIGTSVYPISPAFSPLTDAFQGNLCPGCKWDYDREESGCY